MSLFRSTDPTTWDDVDGIIINESAPAPNIAGVAANVAIIVGQTQRGEQKLTEVGSIGEFHELFGKASYGVNIALKNKRFGRLKVIRAIAADAGAAEIDFDDSTNNAIYNFKAKYKGVYGALIKVKIENGSTVGKKITVQDTNPNAVLPTEVYDNVESTTAQALNVFANSKLVDVTVLDDSDEPDNTVGFVALVGGSDGTITDADYQAAIALAGVENAGNILFLDEYNSTRNGYLKTHVADNPDKMVICAGPESDTKSAAITAVASLRDTEGRIIYGFPWVQTSLDGVLTYTSPASWIASVISQTAPNVDPAYVSNSQFLGGITSLKGSYTRADYIQFKDAGIMAFEADQDIGFKIKSGIVTQILDSSKVTVLRRRMADFLTVSIGRFLKNYQNAVNSAPNRLLVKGAIATFVDGLERDGILPKDSEVQGGKAKLIDTESLNTNSSIAAGFFKILYKQRIYSSMRYIVLQAEIGEGVVVTEQ